MKCCDYELMISAYADGELYGSAKAELEAHMESCAKCREFCQQTLALQREITGALTHCPETPDMASAIMARLIPNRRMHIRWAWAVAAGLMILTFGLYVQFCIGTSSNVVHKRPVRQMTDRPNNDVPGASQITAAATQIRTAHKSLTPKPAARLTAKAPIAKPQSRHTQAGMQMTHLQNATAQTDAETPEVSIQYVDSGPTAERSGQLVLTRKPEPTQKVVNDTEEVILNGKRIKRICSRVVQSAAEPVKEENSNEAD